MLQVPSNMPPSTIIMRTSTKIMGTLQISFVRGTPFPMNILDVGRGATFACERSRVKMGDVIASTSIDIYI
jgi:hypothetical protein